jgi:hypothetical protein
MQPCHQKTSEKETMGKQISCITSIINDYDLMVVWFLHEMVEQWTSDNSFLLNYCPMLLQVSKQHITSIFKSLQTFKPIPAKPGANAEVSLSATAT